MTVGANHMLGCGFVGSAVTMGSAVGSVVGSVVGAAVGSAVVGSAVGSAIGAAVGELRGGGRYWPNILGLDGERARPRRLGR